MMHFLLYRLPNGFTVLDELATVALTVLVVGVVIVAIRDFANHASHNMPTDNMPSGLKDDPIELLTLSLFEAVPGHWYRFKGVKFHLVGTEWQDENGRELESNTTGDNWL